MTRPLAIGLTILLCTGLVRAGEIDTANLPPRTLIDAVAERPVPAWLKDNLRIAHLPGLGWRMLDEVLAAGYNVVTVNSLRRWDLVGPTASLYKPEEVAEADSYIRRFVKTTHAAGAKAVLYIGPVQTAVFSKPWAEAHGDWLLTGPDGKRSEHLANIRSKGFEQWLAAQMAHLVREYGVDGFWWDGYAPPQLRTYDEETRSAFRQFSGGADIPARLDPVADPVSRKYLAWHDQHFVDFADRMRGVIREANPEAVIFVNYSANRTWYFPSSYMGEYPAAYTRAIDVPSVELYWDNPGDALYQQFCYAFLEGVKRGGPATVWVQPAAHGLSGVAPELEMRLRGLEGAPWGVYMEFVEDTGREEYLRQHADDMKARQEWMTGSRALPYIGVVASEQTRAFYGTAALPMYFSHTLGAFRAAFEEHLPVQVLTEYELEDAQLRGVKVLVLPNVAAMSDRAVEVVRRFVAGGGGLVATFESSLYDHDGTRRGDFALADLFHAQYLATHPVAQRADGISLRLIAEHPVVADPLIRKAMRTAWRGGDGPPPADGELALVASAVKVRPLDGGQPLAEFTPGYGATEKLPAIIVSQYGKGRVVYLPAAIDKGMFFYPDGYMRKMLASAYRWAAGQEPQVQVHGPLILGATFRHQPDKGRTIVHLLNDGSSWGRHSIYQKIAPLPAELIALRGHPDSPDLRGTYPVREEIIPLHDIKVVCRREGVTKATLQPENLSLPLTKIDGGVEVTVPKLEMHSMVIFE